MNETWAFVIGFLIFFGGLIGSLVYSDRLEHGQKMECMKQRGEYIHGACIFREAKPQQ
jgi:hypothetical protein